STFHTDLSRELFRKVPLESATSSVSSLVTLTTPGVAADSNGLFHGLGDHAQNSFSVDGQPITDQQSKVFSNQIPSESIQSLEVISGAPHAEFFRGSRVWWEKLGEFYRAQRTAIGAFSRSAGADHIARQGESRKRIRPRGL